MGYREMGKVMACRRVEDRTHLCALLAIASHINRRAGSLCTAATATLAAEGRMSDRAFQTAIKALSADGDGAPYDRPVVVVVAPGGGRDKTPTYDLDWRWLYDNTPQELRGLWGGEVPEYPAGASGYEDENPAGASGYSEETPKRLHPLGENPEAAAGFSSENPEAASGEPVLEDPPPPAPPDARVPARGHAGTHERAHARGWPDLDLGFLSAKQRAAYGEKVLELAAGHQPGSMYDIAKLLWADRWINHRDRSSPPSAADVARLLRRHGPTRLLAAMVISTDGADKPNLAFLTQVLKFDRHDTPPTANGAARRGGSPRTERSDALNDPAGAYERARRVLGGSGPD